MIRFLVAVTLLTLAACEEAADPPVVNHREAKPPPGTGATGDICMIVRNRAPFSITGRVVLKTRERATFRIGKNQSDRLCLSGTLYGGNTVSFVITNFVTIPIFSCYTRPDQAIDVYATRRAETWQYQVTCWR